ncbi:DUF805 domain-containing protein [Woodsholea maritima]|uniref:DUF805 domain-containing protein n=1 Tax=Woodsholea maritima TaxID=240237 RepID=UPI000365FB55|nr:DUF805 domain-containing protein [Woodsholea maritima]
MLNAFWHSLSRGYFDFKGRARRLEFWTFLLVDLLIYFAIIGAMVYLSIIEQAGQSGQSVNAIKSILVLLFFIYFVAFFIPRLAVSVRRLHDVGLTGWLIFLGFIPFGGFVLLIIMLQDSQMDNKYGPNPKELAHLKAMKLTT